MTRLESGDLWHMLSKQYQDKYHGGEFQYHHRYGFNVELLSTTELHVYVTVYTATMQARGQHQGLTNAYEVYKRDILKGNRTVA